MESQVKTREIIKDLIMRIEQDIDIDIDLNKKSFRNFAGIYSGDNSRIKTNVVSSGLALDFINLLFYVVKKRKRNN